MALAYSLAMFGCVFVVCPIIGVFIGRWRTNHHILVRQAFMRIVWPILIVYFAALLVIYGYIFARAWAGMNESPITTFGCLVVAAGPIVGIVIALIGEREGTQRKKMWCRKCGYPRGTSGKCPECGATA
jgi:uncharacterized membrane protein